LFVNYLNNIFYFYAYVIKSKVNLGIGDWGLGIGDWGLGIGDWAQSPIPNPQSPFIFSHKTKNIFTEKNNNFNKNKK